ncbi:MAG: hypothetical protein H4O13_07085 [Xanthomonadales bacterium]|nr:hypothetical protein [Xanthomonadales bacterium]
MAALIAQMRVSHADHRLRFAQSEWRFPRGRALADNPAHGHHPENS